MKLYSDKETLVPTVCDMILLWLFCITFIFTITTQHETVANVNATNVLDILEAIQRISEDKDVIILSMKEVEIPRSPNETTIINDDVSNYVESENEIEDLKYLNEQDDTQSPKMKNILRWLPKKKRNMERKRERAEKAAIEEQKHMGRAQNAKRVADIVSVIKNNHLAASFMYSEIKRIQRDRIIIDNIREMILRVERSENKGYKQSVIDCYNKAKSEAEVEAAGLWGIQTNNLVINVVKDSLNDGLTTITLLHADFAIGSDLQDLVNTIKSEGEYSENDPRQHFSKKSLVIFITDLPSELAEEENDQEDKTLLLRSQDLSGDLLKVDNDELGEMAANHSIIKKNGNNKATHGVKLTSLKRRPRHTSEERMHIRKQQALVQSQRDHERRVREIVDHVSVNYQSCIYLAYEAQRIKNGRVVMDAFRKMAEDLDNPKYQGLKAKALKCGRPISEHSPFVWHKPNRVVMNIVKDSLNDGVY